MLTTVLAAGAAYLLGKKLQARRDAQVLVSGGGFDLGTEDFPTEAEWEAMYYGLQPEIVGQVGQGGMIAQFNPQGAGQVMTPSGAQNFQVEAPQPVQYYGPAGAPASAFPYSGGGAAWGWGFPFAYGGPGGLAWQASPAGLSQAYAPSGLAWDGSPYGLSWGW